MPQNKNQHYVPASYFRLFSKDGKTINIFNVSNEKPIEDAPIKNQCSKDYFYSKNTEIDSSIFSYLEGLLLNKLKKIIESNGLNCLSWEEKWNEPLKVLKKLSHF